MNVKARGMQLSPSRTVVTSFNPRQTPTTAATTTATNYYCNNNEEEDFFDKGDWVLSVHSTPSYISCALSNGEIQIYDPRRLHIIQTISRCSGAAAAAGGGGMITDLVGAPPQQNAEYILISSGTDGTVCLTDLRQHQQSTAAAASFSLHNSQEQALSVSLGLDGNVAAVGSNKSKIHFYDIRQAQQPLGSYVNSHTDEVTRVRFQQFPCYFSSSPTTSGILLTGSEDGLACIFDTTQPTEEAALKSVMNAQTPLRQVGFFGPSLEGVYCMTGSETMSLWAWDSAQCIADYSDIRNMLHVDYLVNAHWDYNRKELSIVAGCNNGDACLSTIGTEASSTTTASATVASGGQPQITTSHYLTGGHRGVVRDWCPLSSSLLATVGEDARMCEWNLLQQQAHSAGKTMMTAGQTVVRRGSDAAKSSQQQQQQQQHTTGGPVRRRKKKSFASPY